MKKLLLLVGLVVLFSPLVHAGQYDGKWEGATSFCRINSDNFSARYELTIKNDHATMYQYHSNTNKNQIHKGKVHGFTKKNKLGLNGKLGHISGKFTSSGTLLFKYDDSKDCSVRMTKISKSTNTDTAKNTIYCKTEGGSVYKSSNPCSGTQTVEISKMEYEKNKRQSKTTKVAKVEPNTFTFCRNYNNRDDIKYFYKESCNADQFQITEEEYLLKNSITKKTTATKVAKVEPNTFTFCRNYNNRDDIKYFYKESCNADQFQITEEEYLLKNSITKKTTATEVVKVEPKKTITKITEQTVTVVSDTTGPEIKVAKSFKANQNMIANINGRVKDDSKIVSLTIDGDQVAFTQGRFNQPLYVLPNGQDVEIVAIDKFGNQSKTIVTLKRAAVQIQTVSIDKLNPLAIKTPINNNAVALIIGIEDYENTFKAAYAKKDALFFHDFAHQAFGVPRYNIKLLTNSGARRNDTLLQIATWLPKVIKENKTDFYLFFSGHGLASANGEDLFLLPYDGYPAILEDSALLRNRIFESIASLNPRSVTVFLDTCYSGATRSEEMLVAARPIMIEVEEQEIPNNFTVFSASANNEIASVFKEAEHGLFSYFLMKGLEGEADKNNDQQITNGELIAFINKNVSRQANQTPQLAGDANRILVQW